MLTIERTSSSALLRAALGGFAIYAAKDPLTMMTITGLRGSLVLASTNQGRTMICMIGRRSLTECNNDTGLIAFLIDDVSTIDRPCPTHIL
jgi:hypothetical protein